MVQEKRKYKRVDIPLDVKINAIKEKDVYCSGITKNFSRSGLCLESFDCAPESMGKVLTL